MKRLSYQASLDFLFNLEKSGIKLGLDRTYSLLAAIGDPHRRFKSIHIAGTNGKGSVACFLNSILFHNGFRTGLFTSPHLVDYRERIRTDGRAISRAELTDLVSQLASPIVETGASYFEATTALAFEHFARKDAEVAAVEVGMGGRLDSTNVIEPLASCITSIDFDHTKYLGKTLSRIAGEKAGIIKGGVPVVCGKLSKQASSKINEIGAQKGSTVFEIGRHATFRPLRMDLSGSTLEYHGLSGGRVVDIATPGLHQMTNAATALLVVEVLKERGFSIGDQAIGAGLRSAFWPGRLQVLRRRPLVVCDAAHNVSGARLLARSLNDLGLKSDVIVFGVLRDKDYPKMLSLLARCSDRFVLTRPESKRALPIWKLKEAARELRVKHKATASVPKALDLARDECGSDGTIVICGSLYMIGEAMQHLGYKPHLTPVC
jgi:dihydrofolate synthase/folylpolyglutamate synthase